MLIQHKNSFAIVLHIEEKLLQKDGICRELSCSEKEVSQSCFGHLEKPPSCLWYYGPAAAAARAGWVRRAGGVPHPAEGEDAPHPAKVENIPHPAEGED